jgi:SulP family sulfate permease
VSYCVMKDLDRAIEYCENSLLQQASTGTTEEEEKTLNHLLPAVKDTQLLQAFFEKMSAQPGEIIYRQGEKGSDLFYLASGTLEIFLNYNTATEKRLKKMNAGTILGEIALYTETVRSATVVASTPCVLYHLSANALKKMNHDYPDVAIQFHEKIVELLATRLVQANKYIIATTSSQ